MPNWQATIFPGCSVMTFDAMNLTLSRDKRTIVRNVSLRVAPGEILGLLGPNGAGKSTLLAGLAGELLATAGMVMLDAVDIAGFSPLQQAQRRAVVTQQSHLNFELSVDEVLAMGAYPFDEVNIEQVYQWSLRAMTLTELTALKEKKYTALSGGEQQRVQLARALVQCFAIEHVQGCAYLLLDEPLANLDPRHQIQFMKVIEQLVRDTKVGVLLVVHDINLAARHCDRLLLLCEGEVIAHGSPQSVLTSAILKRTYGLDCSVIAHPVEANRLLVLT